MPELPEVERGREIAAKICRGRRVERVHCPADPIGLAGCTAAGVRRALRDATVTEVGRHGKQLWLELDRRPWVLVHFGMTGSFQGRDGGPRPKWCRLDLTLEGGGHLAFTDPRRFGRIGLADDPRNEPPVSRLGFDPLLGLPSPVAFRRLLERRRGNVKGLLLDQTFAAGVGNWIADEVLYQSRIDPHRDVEDLLDAEILAIRRTLGSIVRTAVRAKSVSSRFPRTWLFHRRWGRDPKARTHDGRPLEHETIAGRTTAWVPEVQR